MTAQSSIYTTVDERANQHPILTLAAAVKQKQPAVLATVVEV